MAKKRVKSRPGLFDTVYYYDENGKPIGKSRPGLIEGTRVYTDQNGRYAGKSRPGFFAKEVFTDTEHNHITSYDSLCGEVHFEEDYLEEDLAEELEEYEDTDADVADYEEQYNPKTSQYTVVKNLQLFVLCLVICMVIACIYAIVRFN